MTDFMQFAGAAVDGSGRVPLDKSLHALVNPGRGRKVRTFSSLLEFDAYNEWFLQLHEFS